MEPGMQANVSLTNTIKILTPSGNDVVSEGFILRRVSKFLTGTSEDGIIPIPCFYDIMTGEILTELLPKEIRAEYEREKI
jgi:hypothetical protein